MARTSEVKKKPITPAPSLLFQYTYTILV
jgi:hypothetical protein